MSFLFSIRRIQAVLDANDFTAKTEQRKIWTEANAVGLNGAVNAAVKTGATWRHDRLIGSYRLPGVVHTTAGVLRDCDRRANCESFVGRRSCA